MPTSCPAIHLSSNAHDMQWNLSFPVNLMQGILRKTRALCERHPPRFTLESPLLLKGDATKRQTLLPPPTHITIPPGSIEKALLGLLRSLGPELHQAKHEHISAEDEDAHDTRVSPAVHVLHQVHRLEVLAAILERAHAATGRRVGVDKPAAGAKHALAVALEVLRTCRSVGRVEKCKFAIRAVDLGSPNVEYEHTAHQVVERVQPIKPVSPESLNLLIGHQDTAEGDEGTDDERVGEGGSDGVGRIGGNELTDRSVDKLIHEHDEKGRAGTVRVRGEADSVIPAHKVEHGADAEVRDLRHDQARDERNPRVHLGLSLARLENVAALDEQGLQLGDDAGSHKDEVEDGEQTQLEIADRVANHPEREAVEECRTNVQSKLVVDVVGVAENCHVCTVADNLDLLPQRHGKLVSVVDSSGRTGGSILDNPV